MLLFLLGFGIAGLRYETEAVTNSASILLENNHIINYMFRVYKCTCTNIKVGMVAKLQRENLDSNEQQTNEGSNIQSFFPALIHVYVHVFHLRIINYNTGLTDQSSSNHIPLDNEYQALSKPSHAPPPPPLTHYDTMNQNSSKVCMYNIQQCSACTGRE